VLLPLAAYLVFVVIAHTANLSFHWYFWLSI